MGGGQVIPGIALGLIDDVDKFTSISCFYFYVIQPASRVSVVYFAVQNHYGLGEE